MGRPQPTILTRMRWYLTIYAIKLLVSIQTFILNNLKPERPTYRKRYAALPEIENAVFLPQNYKPTDGPLPLLIDIHGGGFTIGAPAIDNPDNHTLASYGICIVSIGYRLAPRHKFPTAVYDVATLIQAVLADPDLPIDPSKVAIAGYSAGGCLALAAPQLNNLHARIKGVVACYPVTDFDRGTENKLKTAHSPPGRKDILVGMSDMFHWAYLGDGVDMSDPLLAPIKADRTKIPEKVYILGCEYDILCREAEDTAEVYAEADRKAGCGGERSELVGVGRVGWREENVTWEKLLGMEHGFNQRASQEMDRKIKKAWSETTKAMHKNVAEWLFKEVYM